LNVRRQSIVARTYTQMTLLLNKLATCLSGYSQSVSVMSNSVSVMYNLNTILEVGRQKQFTSIMYV